jgi:DNA modification methylase
MVERREIWAVDNLDGLQRLQSGSVVLAYLDPPFNSGRSYDAYLSLSRSSGYHAGPAFEDRWSWDESSERSLRHLRSSCSRDFSTYMVNLVGLLGRTRVTAYLLWLAPRLFWTHQVLADKGSLYLHCDPTSSHYLKAVLDRIFGHQNFLNEIVWRRTHAHSSSKRFGPNHDIILFYGKSHSYTWTPIYTAYDSGYLSRYYIHEDQYGKHQLITCTAPGDRVGTRAHYVWHDRLPPPGRHWAWTQEQMAKFEKDGRLVYSSNGVPRLKRYVTDAPGVAVQDTWVDIQRLDAHSLERVGFDTQKPAELLDRILRASTRPGDLVVDPFCGSGTTLVAAERLSRTWIGMDSSLLACSLSLGRTRPEVGTEPVHLVGFPSNVSEVERVRAASPMEFGIWGTSLLATLPDRRYGSDGLMVGTGRIKCGNRKVPVVSLVPMSPTTTSVQWPAPKGKSRQITVVLDDGTEAWKGADVGTEEAVTRVSVESMTSSESSSRGIAPELLRIARGM